MFFVFLLAISAFSLAGFAAFISVYGLVKIYSSLMTISLLGATFTVSEIMIGVGASIEAGKLMAASYLYRYWNDTGVVLRTYLFLGIVVAMFVTSIGIYGFLTASYQTDSVPLKEIDSKISLLTNEKSELSARLKQIDDDISRVASNFVSKRLELKKAYAKERERNDARILEITAEIHSLTNKQINQQAHTGPIIYIAKAFGKEVDDAIVWLTLLIMMVFDPLAVALTICVNIALVKHYKNKNIAKEESALDKLNEQKNEIEKSLDMLKGLASELTQSTNITVDELQHKLNVLNKKEELTEDEKRQKQELELLLAHSAKKDDIRKMIRTRTPDA